MCEYNLEIFRFCQHVRKVRVSRPCAHRRDRKHYTTKYSRIVDELVFPGVCPDCVMKNVYNNYREKENEKMFAVFKWDAKSSFGRLVSTVLGRKPEAVRERDRERAEATQSAGERNFGGLQHYVSLASMTSFEEVAFEGVSRQG